jgi:hypothetical protein
MVVLVGWMLENDVFVFMELGEKSNIWDGDVIMED